MIKKILGYFFYLLGALCVLSFIGNLMRWFQASNLTSAIQKGERFGAMVFAGVLAYLFFKYARKWTNKKTNSEINDIGNE